MAVISFFIFFLIHIVVLPRINKKAIIKWIIYIYACGLIFSIFTFESFALYTLMVAIYVMGFLGVMMTSVRIRLLGLIAAEGEKIGISTAKILKQYNKKVIIKNRLSRLLASGDLRLHDGNYSLGRRFSYFYFHNWITSLFRRLYD